jgi:thiol-disulfide isomerase/thioredoxin
MRTLSILLGAAAAGVLAALAAVGLHQHFGTRSADAPAETAAAQRLPAFAFADLDGRMRRAGEWAGRVLVINFWATWCPPCRRELPAFAELQARYEGRGVQFLAIAIDDVEAVRRFATEHPFNFPVLHGEDAATRLAAQLGNRLSSLPYTVVVDRRGDVRVRHFGEYARDDLERALVAVLRD